VAFANPLPWWVLALILATAAAVAWQTYRRMAASLPRRAVLTVLRLAALLTIVLFLMRPVARTSDAGGSHAVVPILVDTSRSMGIQDAGGSSRIDEARRIVVERLMPELGPMFQVEVLGFGEALVPRAPDQLAATARRSGLQEALGALRHRYGGQVVPGAVLLSDGGDTGGGGEDSAGEAGVAIYPIGIGANTLEGDREVLSVTAADAVLDASRIDLGVTAITHGASAAAIDLRLLENGRPIGVAHLTPAGKDAPVHHVFRASPPAGAATIYTVEIPASAGDPVPENNTRSVLVQGPSRPRRVLLVEGAPGFEHSFLKRAWAGDRGLEVDAVVRKGTDEGGAGTFYVQAARSRSDALVSGFPGTLEALSAYDAVVLANVDAALLTGPQLEATTAFVSRRGGGLLVLGAASLGARGLTGSPLAEALPLRRAGGSSSERPVAAGGVYRVTLTSQGTTHPMMQIAEDVDATRKRWAAVPPLGGVAVVGGAAPGATVLAEAGDERGTARPLVAVQRFGAGRTMVFAGEASWRWRMHLPSSDRTYETFWRQALRWLSLPADDPIRLTLPAGATPGDSLPLGVLVRSRRFEAVAAASVDVRVSAPDGRMEESQATPAPGGAEGLYEATFQAAAAGLYRVTVEARSGTSALGSSSASVLVGGADVEMTDARLDNELLHRIALASGGRVVGEADVAALAGSLRARLPAAARAATRDLWNTAWCFVAIVGLLSSEWILRRRWGLR
jgi:uncharacterized membrane protein